MTLTQGLTIGIVVCYAAVMLGGWALSAVGRLSARHWPAMSQAGTAVALLPTYLFALWLARLTGNGRPQGDPLTLLGLFATVVATVVMLGLAIGQGLRAGRDERAAGGC